MDKYRGRGSGSGSGRRPGPAHGADDPRGHTTRYEAPPPAKTGYGNRGTTGRRLDLRYPAEPGAARRGIAPPRGEPVTPPPRPAAKPVKKSRYGALYAAVIFTGIVVCVSAFTLIFGNFAQSTSASGPSPTPRPTTVNMGVPETRRDARETCLIQAADPGTRTFTLYNIDSGRTFYAVTTGSTEMKDSYGGNLVFAEFKPGDVVDVVYPENDPVLTSIRQSPSAVTFTNQDGLVVDASDPALGRIQRGNSSYVFGQELVSLYRGEPYDIALLTPADKVTMRVYKHVCVFVEVTAGNGVIDVRFNEHIRGGSIAVGTNIYRRLDQSLRLSVSEGTHTVIIKGDNIEDIIRDVIVPNGETAVIDLADAQFKRGVVYFAQNIDAPIYLTVNDHAVDINAPLTLEYGSYNIKATAMGYLAHERLLELREPLVNYTVSMEPLPTPTPRPERIQTLSLSITTTNVGGVEVYIDGAYVGVTPEGWNVTEHKLTFNCEVGWRQLTLKKAGYITIDTAILLDPEKWSHDIQFHMHPEY